MTRRKARVRQHETAFRTWGGARAGAGRKPKGDRAGVSHREREEFAPRFPVHVTARVHKGLPSLRREAARRALERAFAESSERTGFRLIHYSIQSNHLHLIVEASDRSALSRGMQGLSIRIARVLNRLWQRTGSVFSDRYHARILRTPREVRYALAYTLLNERKHGLDVRGIDPCTSGEAFDGWRDGPPGARVAAAERVVEPRTWLLRIGWRRWGLVRTDEVPGS